MYFFGRLKIGRKSRKKMLLLNLIEPYKLNKGSYVIDCGANVGEFTKLLEKDFLLMHLSLTQSP